MSMVARIPTDADTEKGARRMSASNESSNKELTKAPFYQRLLAWVAWLGAGLFLLGGVLDAITNASYLTSKLTHWLTGTLIILWITAEFLIRRYTPQWRTRSGRIVFLKSLGPSIRGGLLGGIALLWLSRAFFAPKPEKLGLELTFGANTLAYGNRHDLVYAIPASADPIERATTHIPLYIHNPTTNEGTIEDVAISFHYPEDTPIGISRNVNEKLLGVKEAGRIQRRSEVFEGHVNTYIYIDSINPSQSFFLAEPIEFYSGMIAKSRTPARVHISVTAKDLAIRELQLDIYAIRSWRQGDVERQFFTFIYKRAVLNRKNSSFWSYLQQTFSREDEIATFVYPEFRTSTDSRGHLHLLSDALHDKVSYATFDPAPFDYLFAPYKEAKKAP